MEWRASVSERVVEGIMEGGSDGGMHMPDTFFAGRTVNRTLST
jgi:hypothetical protein